MPRYWELINGFKCWVSHPQDLSSSFPLRLCCWKVGFFKTVRAKRLSPATWMTNWYHPDINSQRENKFCMYYLQKKLGKCQHNEKRTSNFAILAIEIRPNETWKLWIMANCHNAFLRGYFFLQIKGAMTRYSENFFVIHKRKKGNLTNVY